jgi:hypothetical protein
MPSSPAINAGVSPGSVGDQSRAPHSEYRHPASVAARNSDGSIDIGAFEFVGDAVFADGFDGTP